MYQCKLLIEKSLYHYKLNKRANCNSYRWSIHRGYCRTFMSPFKWKNKIQWGFISSHTYTSWASAFLCYIYLYVTIESEDIIHNVTIPPKSFFLAQNNQYVQSEQVIVEICAGTYTFNLKERVRKHIYFNSKGEMHWSTVVYHAPKFTYNNVHLLWVFVLNDCLSNLSSEDDESAKLPKKKKKWWWKQCTTHNICNYGEFFVDCYGTTKEE